MTEKLYDKLTNKEGSILINEAKKHLEPSGLLEIWQQQSVSIGVSIANAESTIFGRKEFETPIVGHIDNEEKSRLESLNLLTDKAQILVNKDGTGAFVLSSQGSASLVGQEPSKAAEPSKQYSYLREQAINALKSGGIVNVEEKEILKKLDATLDDVALVVTDDGKKVLIADRNGNIEKITAGDVKIADAGNLPRQNGANGSLIRNSSPNNFKS